MQTKGFTHSRARDRFEIEPAAVADYRAQLAEMVRGVPVAEAAVEGFSDWQVVEAMERLWAAGTGPIELSAGEAPEDEAPTGEEPSR